jgi:hypothetical protein
MFHTLCYRAAHILNNGFYNWQAQEALERAKEGLSEETKKAYQEMRLYKFYPLPSPDTPHTAGIEKVQNKSNLVCQWNSEYYCQNLI